MLTIAVLNQKGGVGKTTIAVNLAAAAELDGRHAILIDLDRQGSAFEWYAARAEGSRLAQLVTVKADAPLSAPRLLQLASGYDFVVLDGPPRLDKLTRSAAVAADVIVIPVQPSPADIWAASDTLEVLDEADAIRAESERPPARRVFLVNRAIAGTVMARQAPVSLAEKGEVLGVVIHQRIVFAEAFAVGESVLTFEPNGQAAEEIQALYSAVLSLDPEDRQRSRERRTAKEVRV